MRLLLFSDLHASPESIARIIELSDQADVLVGAGDFGNERRQLSLCIDQLAARIAKPAVLVAGNNESTDELRAACRMWPSAVVLHGKGAAIGGIDFYGMGGGVPVTPFGDWSYDFSEDEAETLLADCPPGCVLVTHSPPYGAADITSAGKHMGSIAVYKAILRTAPRLTVSGHIHASSGRQATIESTLVVNAGPGGMLVTLNG